jgi:hypothetical protein
MRKKDIIKKLATKNSRVDLDLLLESLRMTNKVRRIGIRGPGYRIVPLGTRRVCIIEDAEDPRTIKLQHRA